MSEIETINFEQVTYSQETLKELSIEQLLELRNSVASVLKVNAINAFKDIEQARSATWKALEKFVQFVLKQEAKAEKKPAAPKEPRVVKGAFPRLVK